MNKVVAFILCIGYILLGVYATTQNLKDKQFIYPIEKLETIKTVGSAYAKEQVEQETTYEWDTGVASWYGFESCTNPKCLQANTKPLVEGDNGMACSSRFRLGDRVVVRYLDVEQILQCTDRGGFEIMGRTFDLHKWNFEKFENLNKGLIKVQYRKL